MDTKNISNTPKSLELSEGQLEVHFRRLHLAHMRRIYKEVAALAEKESWTYRDFLALLLAEEVAGRKQTRLQRCTRNAHFPFFKTIDEFDFTLQSTLRQSLLGSYLGPDFVTEGRSLILHGKTGRGKTHLAVAIGYRAIQNGFETFFTTAAELIEDLSNASKKGNLQESLATYTHAHVLVIDEVGYLTYGPDAANVLFHVVNDRHLRKRPMIFTTNKPMTEWGKVLHDEDMAAAILDRVLERGRLIHLDGPSGRTRHLNLEESLPPDTKRLRISGIGGSEFPEPTIRHRLTPKKLPKTGPSWTQCWTQKNGPDLRSTEPGLFFCYWHPEIVENRRFAANFPERGLNSLNEAPHPGFDLIGSVNTRSVLIREALLPGDCPSTDHNNGLDPAESPVNTNVRLVCVHPY
jgi:DNA replication protein DnaC